MKFSCGHVRAAGQRVGLLTEFQLGMKNENNLRQIGKREMYVMFGLT